MYIRTSAAALTAAYIVTIWYLYVTTFCSGLTICMADQVPIPRPSNITPVNTYNANGAIIVENLLPHHLAKQADDQQ